MILDYQVIEIDGLKVFEKLSMKKMGKVQKVLNNQACFMFLLQGSFVVRTPMHSFTVSPSEGLLSRCGDSLYEDTRGEKSQGDEVVEAIGIIFHPSLVSQVFKYEQFPKKTKLPPKIKIDHLLDRYKEGLLYYMQNPEIFDREMQLLKVKELLLILLRYTDAPSVQDFIATLFSPQEFDFRQTVEENLYANLNLTDFAFLCSMSLATFKRRFKEVFSESPADYIKQRKLEKAAKLLGNSKTRITELAYDCGFESISTFNRIFKKQYGQSPSDFRLSQNE